MQKYKKLILNIFIFGIGGFGRRILSFLFIPLYTTCLTTEDYGTADLLINIVQLFLPIFSLGIHNAVLSFALDGKHDSGVVCRIGARYNIIATTMFLFSIFLLKIFDIIRMDDFYIIFLGKLYVITIWYDYFLIIAKIYNKIVLFTFANFISTSIYVGLNFLLLKFLSMGIIGYMSAYIAGMTVALIVLILNLRGWNIIRHKYDKFLSTKMRRFSCPLVFNQTAWWINNVSDRYMLAWILGTHLNGIYAVSYKIPTILSICQGFVTQAWSISAIEERESEKVDVYYSKVFSIYFFALCVLMSILLIANNFLSKTLFKNDFYEARFYTPILLLAAVYLGCSDFLNSIFIAEKDSLNIMKSTVLGAVINILLNALWIPSLQIYGAAVATAVSCFCIMLYRLLLLTKRELLNIDIIKSIFINIMLVVQIILCRHNIYFWQVCIFLVIIMINSNLLFEICIKGKEFKRHWKKN